MANILINKYWIRLSMISRIIQTEFYSNYTFTIPCKQSVAVKRLVRLILQNFVIFACFQVVMSSASNNFFLNV